MDWKAVLQGWALLSHKGEVSVLSQLWRSACPSVEPPHSWSAFLLFELLKYLECVSMRLVCVRMCARTHTCSSQETICGNQFCSIIWILESEPVSSRWQNAPLSTEPSQETDVWAFIDSFDPSSLCVPLTDSVYLCACAFAFFKVSQ